MKAYDNGSGFTVSYNRQDCAEFARSWPCSTVKGTGWFCFDKRNYDLVDLGGTASRNDGEDWLAFSRDCQKYGEVRLAGATPAAAMTAVWNLRHPQASA